MLPQTRHHKQLAVSRLVLFASSSGTNRAMKRRAVPNAGGFAKCAAWICSAVRRKVVVIDIPNA